MSTIEEIIKEKYLAGDTLSSISKVLNDSGFKTPKGHRWSDPSVSGIVGKLKLPRRVKPRDKGYLKDQGYDIKHATAVGIKDPQVLPFEDVISRVKPRSPSVMINLYEDHWSDLDFKKHR